MSQSSLAELLSLTSPPISITFTAAPPAGVPHVSAGEPAGCGYWRRAAAGEVAINSDRTAASFGCVGNRVYTGADETEAYFAVPGAHLGAIEQSLAVIVRANEALESFHRGRAAEPPSA